MQTLLALSLFVGCAKKAPAAPVVVDQAPAAREVVHVIEDLDPQGDPVVAELHANFQRVFFPFDSAELNEASLDALQENAGILQEHPDLQVTIEGHADERGTVDYNLALAERRAQTVVRALLRMGVAPGALDTVSYGEERPLLSGDSPSAWSANRRAEFRVTRSADGMVDGSLDNPVELPVQPDLRERVQTETTY